MHRSARSAVILIVEALKLTIFHGLNFDLPRIEARETVSVMPSYLASTSALA